MPSSLGARSTLRETIAKNRSYHDNAVTVLGGAEPYQNRVHCRLKSSGR